MASIPRLTPVEVDDEQLMRELKEHVKSSVQSGTFIRAENDEAGEPISKGDVVYLKPQAYKDYPAAEGSPLLIVATVPEARLIFCAFYDKQGNRTQQFFVDNLVERKQGSAKAQSKKAVARKRS